MLGAEVPFSEKAIAENMQRISAFYNEQSNAYTLLKQTKIRGWSFC